MAAWFHSHLVLKSPLAILLGTNMAHTITNVAEVVETRKTR